MRLLDTRTAGFVEKDPNDQTTVYAILSHTWDSTGEQTLKQLSRIQEKYLLGHIQDVRGRCKLAPHPLKYLQQTHIRQLYLLSHPSQRNVQLVSTGTIASAVSNGNLRQRSPSQPQMLDSPSYPASSTPCGSSFFSPSPVWCPLSSRQLTAHV